jgi:hypothetical protein
MRTARWFPLGIIAFIGLFLLLSGFRIGALPYNPGAPFSDAALSHWPAAVYLRESVWYGGDFPLWRDGIMGGQPFAANPLNKTAYPLQWLALVFRAAEHLDLMIVLHLGLAAWGMARWTRRLGLSRPAAAVSAIGYALGTRTVAHLGAGHLDLLYALAWWPWLMDAARGTPSLSTALRLALFGGLLTLADVRLALFALTLAAAYLLVNNLRAGQAHRLLRLWPVVPIGFAATAALVLPLVGWQPYLSRTGLTPADSGVFSLTFGHWLGVLGFPVDGSNPEQITTLGLPLLVLAIIALVHQWRSLRFWAFAMGVAALYALGSNGPLWTVLTAIVPGLLTFRVPARAWLVLALVVPLLAGYGLDSLRALLQASLPPRTRSRAQLVTLIGLVAAGVGSFYLIALFPKTPINGPSSISLALMLPRFTLMGVSLLLTAVVALGVWLGLTRRVAPHTVVLVALACVAADVTLNGLNWLTWQSRDRWLLPGNVTAQALRDDGAGRVYAPYIVRGTDIETALPQPSAAAYGLSLFGGVDPFQLAGFVDAVEAVTGILQTGYDVVQPPIQTHSNVAIPNAEVLATWGVTHLAVDGSPPPDWTQVDIPAVSWPQIAPQRIYRNPVEARPLNRYGWPDDWPGLPDLATVDRLNGMTLGTWALSMATLVGCAAGLLLLWRLRRD